MKLRQSTAGQTVLIGGFYDSTDGVTAETGLTIANTDIRLSKNGANIVAKNSGGGTHDEGGFYAITLDATDTDTVGRLQLFVNATGAVPVYHEFEVLEEAAYDLLYSDGASPVEEISGDRVTTIATLASQTEFTLTAGSADDDVYNGWAVIVTDSTTATQQALGVITDYVGATRTVTLNADPAIFTMAAGDSIRLIPAFLATGVTVSDFTGAADTRLTNIEGASFDTATDSLEALRNRGDAAWVTGGGGAAPTVSEIRAEIDANSTQLAAIVADTGTTLPTQIAALNDLSAADVNAEVDQAIVDASLATATELAAVRAVTDALTFTVAGQVDVNVQSINDTTVLGAGTSGNLWRA